jgi:hypothetical protein
MLISLLLALFLSLFGCAEKEKNVYSPSWGVNPPDAWGNPKAVTNFHVANVSNARQTITITFYNEDGTHPMGLPYLYAIGGVSGSSSTDQNGRIVMSVPPLNFVAISVLDNGKLHRGFGTITGEVPRGLVASVLLNFPDNLSLMSQTFTINGGNPF